MREAAATDVSALRQLMQLYLYDLGALDGWEIGDDGRYGQAARLEAFWADPAYRCFLVRADGRLAGFGIVRRGSRFPPRSDTTEMSEFFVLRRHRRRGLGARVACELFDRFPGRWEIYELASNAPARAFWRAVIDRYTGGRFTETRLTGADAGTVQHFDTRDRGR